MPYFIGAAYLVSVVGRDKGVIRRNACDKIYERALQEKLNMVSRVVVQIGRQGGLVLEYEVNRFQ